MWFKNKKTGNVPLYNRNDNKNSKDKYNIFWIVSIVFILIFIIIFCLYTKSNKNEFAKVLADTESFYMSNLNYTNMKIETNKEGNITTIIEYKTLDKNYIDERVNARLNFLGERIVHYQKTASDILNWWIAILSILFVLATGINFYSYNESKLKLEKAVEEADGLKRNLKSLLEEANNLPSDVNSVGVLSENNNSKKILVANTETKKRKRG